VGETLEIQRVVCRCDPHHPKRYEESPESIAPLTTSGVERSGGPHGVNRRTASADHFIHIRSGRSDVLPLLLVHGWPSSPVELLNLIEALPEQAFDLVIASLPGCGFSTWSENWGPRMPCTSSSHPPGVLDAAAALSVTGVF
jgi:pimeloyl-ACP methyl ester carboxylesterase